MSTRIGTKAVALPVALSTSFAGVACASEPDNALNSQVSTTQAAVENQGQVDEFVRFVDTVPDEEVVSGSNEQTMTNLRNRFDSMNHGVVQNPALIATILNGDQMPDNDVVELARNIKRAGGGMQTQEIIKRAGGIDEIIASNGGSVDVSDLADKPRRAEEEKAFVLSLATGLKQVSADSPEE